MYSLLLLVSPAFAAYDGYFQSAISRVEQMVSDPTVRSMAAREGLDVVNVTWEDTGRYKGSSVGPNISDMTIGVRDPSGALHPMPVLRFDNFTDTTADVDADTFGLRVGNERNRGLQTVSLTTFLQETRSFLSSPASWAGSRRGLWASRDAEVLVSAQACFLPIPRSGEATFTPVLYNYQSYPGNPAVLAIVATREGTSAQVIQNDGGYLSQPLFFNEAGERAPFVAERLSDWVADGNGPMPPGGDAAAAGLNVVMVIQVPLKQAAPPSYGYGGLYDEAAKSSAAPMAESRRSDVEDAVIGHGEVEGPFREMGGLAIERDARFPVRVTVQFYKATSTGQASASDIREIRRQIDRVYADASYVGSLVTDGYTGRGTEWNTWPRPSTPDATPTATWADPFWSWHTSN